MISAIKKGDLITTEGLNRSPKVKKVKVGTAIELSRAQVKLNSFCTVTMPERISPGQSFKFGDDKTDYEIEVINEPIEQKADPLSLTK